MISMDPYAPARFLNQIIEPKRRPPDCLSISVCPLFKFSSKWCSHQHAHDPRHHCQRSTTLRTLLSQHQYIIHLDKMVRKPANSLIAEWDLYFQHGTLDDWQRLCRDLDLEDDWDLSSKSKCRRVGIDILRLLQAHKDSVADKKVGSVQALRTVHVNIRQFLETPSRPVGVMFFRNVRELEDYTRVCHSFFPRRNIPNGSPLKALLRLLA